MECAQEPEPSLLQMNRDSSLPSGLLSICDKKGYVQDIGKADDIMWSRVLTLYSFTKPHSLNGIYSLQTS